MLDRIRGVHAGAARSVRADLRQGSMPARCRHRGARPERPRSATSSSSSSRCGTAMRTSVLGGRGLGFLVQANFSFFAFVQHLVLHPGFFGYALQGSLGLTMIFFSAWRCSRARSDRRDRRPCRGRHSAADPWPAWHHARRPGAARDDEALIAGTFDDASASAGAACSALRPARGQLLRPANEICSSTSAISLLGVGRMSASAAGPPCASFDAYGNYQICLRDDRRLGTLVAS